MIKFYLNILILILPPAFSQVPVKVTYIANEGVLISNQGRSVLIDALHKEYGPAYMFPSDKLISEIIEGKASFKKIDFLLITHYHRDHLDASLVAEFMQNHPETTLVSTKHVIDSVKAYLPLNFDNKRIKIADHRQNSVMNFSNNGISVQALGIKHTWPARHAAVQNLGFIVNMDGVKIFHPGDAGFNTADFGFFDLPSHNLKVALLPFWYQSKKEDIQSLINPERIVFIHINPESADDMKNRYLKIDSIFTFTVSGETIEFDK